MTITIPVRPRTFWTWVAVACVVLFAWFGWRIARLNRKAEELHAQQELLRELETRIEAAERAVMGSRPAEPPK